MIYVIFDIETRIDKKFILDALTEPTGMPGAPPWTEDDAYKQYVEWRSQKYGPNPILPLICHVPISIAVAVVEDTDWMLKRVYSLGPDPALQRTDPGAWEHAIVADFWTRLAAVQEKGGVIVGFNSRRFDIPVLELAALRTLTPTPSHFETKYGNRYRYQTDHHLDLMEHLTNFGAVLLEHGSLSNLMHLIGHPEAVKGDIDGGQVQRLYEEGKLVEIHRYCRNDCRRAYWLFLVFMYLRGLCADVKYVDACEQKIEME